MRRPIVAGNWKLHGSRADNARLVEEIMAQVPSKPAGQCIVCPPLVYLQEVGRLLRGSSVELGAQDVCAETHGAFTGEVSAAMLKDVGCEYVIVGHSEPVWAIGTGRNATPDQAQDVHAFIRARLQARNAKIAAETRVLYGGSVKAGNAAELFAMPDVDGGLIGGASLKADEFLAILAAARPHD
jgi:triosephosphate isomerase